MTGTEWLVDAEGCSAESLADLERLQSICAQIVADLDLHVVGEPQWHQFPFPGGITGIFLLSESHLTCHTFPEAGTATFNLYCCRPRPDWAWSAVLTGELAAARVNVRRVARQGIADLSAVSTKAGER